MDKSTELLEKLMLVQWMMQHRRFKMRRQAGPLSDPTCGQGRILALLKLKDGLSTKDLSHVLGMRVSSLNEMLSKMEKGGYIERRPSEDDKRVVLAYLTQKGRDESQDEEAPVSLFSCLTDEEQEQFGAYLDRLIRTLEEEMGTDSRKAFGRMARKRDEVIERMQDGDGPFGGEFADRAFFGGVMGFGHGPRARQGRGPRDRQGRGGCGEFDDFDGCGFAGRPGEAAAPVGDSATESSPDASEDGRR